MKSVVQITYEVDLNEINDLPPGYQVLQHDMQYNSYKVLQTHIDFFAANMQRYKYYLFNAPPLPKVTTYQTAEAISHLDSRGKRR